MNFKISEGERTIDTTIEWTPGEKVIVILNEKKYFNSYDSNKDVVLLSKEEMEQKLGLTNMASEKYKKNKFKENNILTIQEFMGHYAGHDQNIVKINPSHGLEHSDAKHFRIPWAHVKNISPYTYLK
jgi:hypothetical protein